MQGASSAWQTSLGVWLDWSLRLPEQLPGSTSNTNKILVPLASSCQALESHETKLLDGEMLQQKLMQFTV